MQKNALAGISESLKRLLNDPVQAELNQKRIQQVDLFVAASVRCLTEGFDSLVVELADLSVRIINHIRKLLGWQVEPSEWQQTGSSAKMIEIWREQGDISRAIIS